MKKVLLKTFTPIFAFLLIIGAFSVNVKAAGNTEKPSYIIYYFSSVEKGQDRKSVV